MTQGTDSVSETRYKTNRFVTNIRVEAERYAERRGISFHEFKQTPNVRLLHQTELWAWWDDMVMTTAVGLPRNLIPRYLTRTAEDLIQKVWISKNRNPSCGWQALARLQRVEAWELLAEGPILGNYRPESLVRLTVQHTDGTRGKLYRWFSVEHFDEPYLWDYTLELPIGRLKTSTIANPSTLVFNLIADLIAENPGRRQVDENCLVSLAQHQVHEQQCNSNTTNER